MEMAYRLLMKLRTALSQRYIIEATTFCDFEQGHWSEGQGSCPYSDV